MTASLEFQKTWPWSCLCHCHCLLVGPICQRWKIFVWLWLTSTGWLCCLFWLWSRQVDLRIGRPVTDSCTCNLLWTEALSACNMTLFDKDAGSQALLMSSSCTAHAHIDAFDGILWKSLYQLQPHASSSSFTCPTNYIGIWAGSRDSCQCSSQVARHYKAEIHYITCPYPLTVPTRMRMTIRLEGMIPCMPLF